MSGWWKEEFYFIFWPPDVVIKHSNKQMKQRSHVYSCTFHMCTIDCLYLVYIYIYIYILYKTVYYFVFFVICLFCIFPFSLSLFSSLTLLFTSLWRIWWPRQTVQRPNWCKVHWSTWSQCANFFTCSIFSHITRSVIQETSEATRIRKS